MVGGIQRHSSRNLPTLSTGVRCLTSVCMFVSKCAYMCVWERVTGGRVWSALKRMQRFFWDVERRDSTTIVVYSGSITLSLCIIPYSRSYHELMMCARSNRVDQTACDLRKRQHLALNRLQSHIFLTTVGLVVGYVRDTHTFKNIRTVLVMHVSMY